MENFDSKSKYKVLTGEFNKYPLKSSNHLDSFNLMNSSYLYPLITIPT